MSFERLDPVPPVHSSDPSISELSGSNITYTIGWICALQEEYESACYMLDEQFEGPEFLPDHDENVYTFGRIARHNIVITCLPMGFMDTNETARVVRDMIRSFPKIQYALMVGIGGGAPTNMTDIRLGDVVVSKPGQGHGGVIQYDFVSRQQGGIFVRKGHLNAPPQALLSAAQKVQADINNPKNPDKIAIHIQRMSDRSDFRRPETDQLYPETYLHQGGYDCAGCLGEPLTRPVRSGNRTIAIHYGTIASGNTLMMDALERDKYARDEKLRVLCFDMVAAGAMNQLPCLVIRGIADYVDTHKNDIWHKYAALTASAYARELLLNLRPRNVISTPPMVVVLGKMTNRLADVDVGIRELENEPNAAKLPNAAEGEFDSHLNGSRKCLAGTRTELCKETAAGAK